jgi:hypothetical protein
MFSHLLYQLAQSKYRESVKNNWTIKEINTQIC